MGLFCLVPRTFYPPISPFLLSNYFNSQIPNTCSFNFTKIPILPLHNAVTASRRVLRASFQKKTYSNGTPLQPNMMGNVDNASCCTFRVSRSTPSLAHGRFLFHEVGNVQIFLFLLYFFLVGCFIFIRFIN